jgi:hypothetical protein
MPISASADGNCLFNALSVALFGHAQLLELLVAVFE